MAKIFPTIGGTQIPINDKFIGEDLYQNRVQ